MTSRSAKTRIRPAAEERVGLLRLPPPPTYTAEYRSALLPEHRGNPLIEALPEIRTGWDLIGEIHRPPAFDPQERLLPAPYRALAVGRLRNFIQPFDVHIPVIDKILRLIVEGYHGRNPCDPAFRKATNQSYHMVPGRGPKPLGETSASTADSAALLSLSGLGKTTLTERTLSFLPQVLAHPDHNILQIVHMKLECPSNGSARALMLHFVDVVDHLLGTDYSTSCKRVSTQPLIPMVSNIAKQHHIGLLVLDEAQSLLRARGDDESQIIRFFVSLTNTLRIPILTLGTLHAKQVLSSTLHLARRAGDTYTWSPLTYSMEEGSRWRSLMEALFEYQWTDVPQPLTVDLSKAYFEETQGITALVVRLHQLCQIHVIGRDDVSEEVTVAVVREVAAERFALVQRILDAIRSGLDMSKQADFSEVLRSLDGEVGEVTEETAAAEVVMKSLLNMGFDAEAAEAMIDAARGEDHDGSAGGLLKAALGHVKGADIVHDASLVQAGREAGDTDGAKFAAALRARSKRKRSRAMPRSQESAT